MRNCIALATLLTAPALVLADTSRAPGQRQDTPGQARRDGFTPAEFTGSLEHPDGLTGAEADGQASAQASSANLDAPPGNSGTARSAAPGQSAGASADSSDSGAAEAAADSEAAVTLQTFTEKSRVWHACGCSNSEFDFDVDDQQLYREMSNEYCALGEGRSRFGFSNFIWSWGQFIDHDLVATVDDADGEPYPITLQNDGETATMTLFRVKADPEQGKPQCRSPISVITPTIDGGTVYGSDERYLQAVLRQPGSCRLRTSAGELLPVTTLPDGRGVHRLVAGDARVNEHAILTSMHTVWMREHNRLCGTLEHRKDMSNDDKFELVRKVIKAKLQHITVHHFLPALGIPAEALKQWQPKAEKPDVSVEFNIAYRFGHDLIPDTIDTFTIVDIFNGEQFFGIGSAAGSSDPAAANAKMDQLLTAVGHAPCAEMDGKFSNALRNMLFGHFEDLATRNMFRSEEMGMAGYEELCKCFGVQPVSAVEGNEGKMHDIPTLMLLQENAADPADTFGPVNLAIIKDQFHRSLFGPGGDWWGDWAHEVQQFKREIEECSLGKVIAANTGASMPADAFRAGPGSGLPGKPGKPGHGGKHRR